MEHLRGTRWWPNFSGALLFLESSEACRGPAELDARLTDYQNMGVFDQINGLLIGRPYHFDDAAKAQLRQIILERTAAYTFPYHQRHGFRPYGAPIFYYHWASGDASIMKPERFPCWKRLVQA